MIIDLFTFKRLGGYDASVGHSFHKGDRAFRYHESSSSGRWARYRTEAEMIRDLKKEYELSMNVILL